MPIVPGTNLIVFRVFSYNAVRGGEDRPFVEDGAPAFKPPGLK